MQLQRFGHGSGSSIGTILDFNQKQSKLTVKREGSYFIYLNLLLKSNDNAHSTNGTVTVKLKYSDRELLTCEVKLAEDMAVEKKCWAVVQHLERESSIIADMIVHGSSPVKGWTLGINESGFGIFLVDSP